LASGAPNDFSRSYDMPISPTHFPDEPKIRDRSRSNMIWEENWGDFVIFLGLNAEIEGKSVTLGVCGASKILTIHLNGEDC